MEDEVGGKWGRPLRGRDWMRGRATRETREQWEKRDRARWSGSRFRSCGRLGCLRAPLMAPARLCRCTYPSERSSFLPSAPPV
eukprot:scaffold110355_cov31-Tisochrysis_lutea.AAC.11